MEDNNNFLQKAKQLKDKKNIRLSEVGTIMNIEEIEHKIFKLTLNIDSNTYKGIYIDGNKIEEKIELKDVIYIYKISLLKQKRNNYLYILLYDYGKNEDIEEENIIKNNEENNIYDLNPRSLIKTLESNINYKSDIFIYKQENKESVLFPILTDEKFIIDNNSNIKDFENFISKNEIKNDSLMLIDNYILNNDKISFNNFTLFNIVKLDYMDEYFKIKFNNDYKNNNIILYKLNINTHNFVLLKVIDIQDKYIIGIDYFLNMYKISKNNEKIKNINDVYTILFIKYFSTTIEAPFYIITLQDNSKIYIFDNSFCDMFLNDLTVIYCNFIDYIEPQKDNYFNLIKFQSDTYSFKILKDLEYYILFEKFNFNYNFYPYNIKLKNINNDEIRCYKFILYLGLLNNINCLINYSGKESYGIEYFYYNFDYNIKIELPEFHTIKINDKEEKITKFDNFNSKTRKRFILLNYNDIENVKIYKDKLNIKKKEDSKNQNKKKIENNEISIETHDLEDIISDDEKIAPKIQNYTSLLFIYYYENKNKKNLLGIYDINDIKDIPPETKIYKPKEEYRIFYDFYYMMTEKKISTERKNEYLQSLEKYTNISEIKELVTECDKDFSNIKYEDYLIYINLCLFYYYNKINSKEKLISDFQSKFNILIDIKTNLNNRIRILRFACREFVKIYNENRTMHLFFLDMLPETNSYRLAINYNKKMINNLDENSKLFIPFLQLDSFILYNYLINSNSYTLSLEPLIITKKHLLSSYEDFFFTCRQKEKDNFTTLAFQCVKNDITTINEHKVFPDEVFDTKNLNGKNYAIPIIIELLHERNGHSKKSKREQTPLYFYKKKKIVKASKDEQENNKEKGEAGCLVEYFIRYKKKSLISELQYNYKLGDIIDKVNLFTSKNFKDLNDEIQIINNKNNSTIKKFISENCLIFNQNNTIDNNSNNNTKDVEEESLEYYEKNYLIQGKYFVYPYSIPVDYTPYGEEEKKFSKGRIEYLEKYKDAINKGRKLHYGEDF